MRKFRKSELILIFDRVWGLFLNQTFLKNADPLSFQRKDLHFSQQYLITKLIHLGHMGALSNSMLDKIQKECPIYFDSEKNEWKNQIARFFVRHFLFLAVRFADAPCPHPSLQ